MLIISCSFIENVHCNNPLISYLKQGIFALYLNLRLLWTCSLKHITFYVAPKTAALQVCTLIREGYSSCLKP